MLPMLACLFACGAPPVVVSVEAHATSIAPAPGSQVVLVPADPRIPPTDPVYAYLAKIVSLALSQRGLQPTPTAGEGRAIISIGWSRDAPKVITRTLATPESGNFRGVPRRTGDVQGLGRDQSLADLSPQIDPLTPNVQKRTVYPWTIELKGLQRQSGAVATQLWIVTANADSASDDAADIAPELIAASMPLIGTDKSRKDIRISASDAAVKSLAVADSDADQAPPANAKR